MLGLGDWSILFKTKQVLSDMAQIDVNIYEKVACIIFSEDFDKLSTAQQKNIILHELVHGRLSIMKLKQEEVDASIEEEFVNDIIRWVENNGNS